MDAVQLVASLVAKFVEIQNKVLTELVNQENERIDNVHVLDSPISYISDLSLSLKNNREQYISEFETQQIDKPMFAKIVKSLINRGFTGEQKQFLRNMTTNGYAIWIMEESIKTFGRTYIDLLPYLQLNLKQYLMRQL